MQDNKLFKIALLIGFITVLICIELPYSDKSIANILIPMIKIPSRENGKSIIQLAGLLPLSGFLWSYAIIVKSKRFNASRFKIFFIMFMLVYSNNG
ncbi:MAG: hypothetical protein PF487_07830 [Bacteroidales bacterium]|jgi:hypothetical protein|nr:hypothetical protein [Bacteroidales bacterium]